MILIITNNNNNNNNYNNNYNNDNNNNDNDNYHINKNFKLMILLFKDMFRHDSCHHQFNDCVVLFSTVLNTCTFTV